MNTNCISCPAYRLGTCTGTCQWGQPTSPISFQVVIMAESGDDGEEVDLKVLGTFGTRLEASQAKMAWELNTPRGYWQQWAEIREV